MYITKNPNVTPVVYLERKVELRNPIFKNIPQKIIKEQELNFSFLSENKLIKNLFGLIGKIISIGNKDVNGKYGVIFSDNKLKTLDYDKLYEIVLDELLQGARSESAMDKMMKKSIETLIKYSDIYSIDFLNYENKFAIGSFKKLNGKTFADRKKRYFLIAVEIADSKGKRKKIIKHYYEFEIDGMNEPRRAMKRFLSNILDLYGNQIMIKIENDDEIKRFEELVLKAIEENVI